MKKGMEEEEERVGILRRVKLARNAHEQFMRHMTVHNSCMSLLESKKALLVWTASSWDVQSGSEELRNFRITKKDIHSNLEHPFQVASKILSEEFVVCGSGMRLFRTIATWADSAPALPRSHIAVCKSSTKLGQDHSTMMSSSLLSKLLAANYRRLRLLLLHMASMISP